jgi:hypothetical protein
MLRTSWPLALVCCLCATVSSWAQSDTQAAAPTDSAAPATAPSQTEPAQSAPASPTPSQSAATLSAAANQVRPRIEFVLPHASERVTDYPIVIKTKVTNFTLAEPVQYWDKVEGPDKLVGHIHYTLDDCPIFATKKTSIVMLKPMGKSLPVGKHILRAELVNPNHDILSPQVFAEIPIFCQRDESKTSAAGKSDQIQIDPIGRDELVKVEQELQKVQEEVSQLKQRLRQVE